MIDIDQELNILKGDMQMDNVLEAYEIEDLIEGAYKEVQESILLQVSASITELSEYALNLGAEEFLVDMSVEETASGWQIGTMSGVLDYSTQPIQMLPRLLSNAKTSKSGELYKVVPINKDKRQDEKTSTTDIFTAMKRRQDKIDTARAELHRRVSVRNERSRVLADQFTDILAQQMASSQRNISEALDQKQMRENSSSGETKVEFRTATSKQNPETDWVIPGKDLDMSDKVRQVNDDLSFSQRETVINAMQQLREHYDTVVQNRYADAFEGL